MNITNYLYRKNIIVVLLIVLTFLGCNKSQIIQVKSPDGEKVFSVFKSKSTSENSIIDFSIKYNQKYVLLPSTLELLSNEIDFSGNVSIINVENSTVNNEWQSNFSELSSILDNYNWLKA